MKKSIINICLFTVSLIISSVATSGVLAGAASMSLSAGKSAEVGQTVTVNIAINPNGSLVDTARAEVSYPANLLSLVSVAPTGPLTSPSPGNKTNSPGHISWGAFTVADPISSSAGFARIIFKALATGSATITLDSSRLIHEGEEVGSGGTGRAQIEIGASSKTPSDLLGLTSPTHPDQSKWYQSDNVVFTWAKGNSDKYLTDFDNTVDTAPTKLIQGNTKQFKNVKSGVWYFHLLPEGTDSPAHFKVQVDNIKPNPIEPYLDISDKQALTVKFSTTDYHSGVASYDVQVNADTTENVTSPFALQGLTVGFNRVTVVAYDQAGNSRSGWVKFTLDADGTVHDIITSAAASGLCDIVPGVCNIPVWAYLLGLLGLILLFVLIFRGRVGVLNVRTITKTNLGTVSKTITKTDPKTGKKLVTKTVTKTDTKNVVETDTGKVSADTDEENENKKDE